MNKSVAINTDESGCCRCIKAGYDIWGGDSIRRPEYWRYMEKLRIPQATSKGYIEVPVGGVFDGSYLTSTTRRGRVQGGGMLCPTLMAGESEIYVFEGVYETDADR